MSRAAMNQSGLAKERRELREQQKNSLNENAPKDIGRAWEDPMNEDKPLAQDMRGGGQSQNDMPEWKKSALGKSQSYGKKSAGKKNVSYGGKFSEQIQYKKNFHPGNILGGTFSYFQDPSANKKKVFRSSNSAKSFSMLSMTTKYS
jgi:hypothetical protein